MLYEEIRQADERITKHGEKTQEAKHLGLDIKVPVKVDRHDRLRVGVGNKLKKKSGKIFRS